MVLETKERFQNVHTTGTAANAGGSSAPWSLDLKVEHQRTQSEPHLFPFVEREKRVQRMPHYWIDFMSRQDLGGPFITEKASTTSFLARGRRRSGLYFNLPWSWSIDNGPLVLSGSEHPLSLGSSTELTALEQTLFALGGTAISRTRPGKPQADIALMIGELKKDGLPSIIGSLFSRSKSLRDVMRNSGNEYLNLQFGWIPLIKDLTAACQAVSNTRKILQDHERMLNKLLRRTYRFDTLVSNTNGLTQANSAYEIHPSQQGPTFSYCRFGVTTGNQVPIESMRTVTKSHFSAGYRFYYPDIDTALDALGEFEHNANVLMGTRLDPEVLWNLAPWTWLVDWFINFGDVLGNISAIISDGLVMQYAYIMQETTAIRQITLPRGLFTRQTSGLIADGAPYYQEQVYHRKVRTKASPFGFGLTPEMFTPQQWAILAALGISRGLK